MERKNKFKSKHSYFLSLAFEQAKNNLGSTKNNPSVGCIVEKNESVISSGFTSFNGRPHAEYNAIHNFNFKKNKKYTLYSTLEPCCHEGRGPSCVSKIIDSKFINRVVFASIDPDIRVNGKGKKKLIESNIDVSSGYLSKEIDEGGASIMRLPS